METNFSIMQLFALRKLYLKNIKKKRTTNNINIENFFFPNSVFFAFGETDHSIRFVIIQILL